jgi:hypothetical protein
MNEELIAPCGINCGICSAYLALTSDIRSRGIKLTYCAGCRPRRKNCAFIKKRCDRLQDNRVQYCYECEDFPCRNLKHIDKRYREYYRMSMIANLEYIRKNGMERFLKKEAEKWRCPECGGVICCHNDICYSCGLEKLREKKQLYRWED